MGSTVGKHNRGEDQWPVQWAVQYSAVHTEVAINEQCSTVQRSGPMGSTVW